MSSRLDGENQFWKQYALHSTIIETIAASSCLTTFITCRYRAVYEWCTLDNVLEQVGIVHMDILKAAKTVNEKVDIINDSNCEFRDNRLN